MADIIYNTIMADKRKEMKKMSAKLGRPTSNPKEERITVRLDKESSGILNDYCEQQDIGKAEAIRQGIKKLKDDIKK